MSYTEFNKWIDHAVCPKCLDERRLKAVAQEEGGARWIPCPVCGLDQHRADLIAARKMMPAIKWGDLTEDEAEIVREWRLRGFHELDCLRWIEGRRYDPSKDQEFLKEARAKFKEWRAR